MNVKTLMGSGHKVVLFTLPFLVVGLTLNILRPSLFAVRGLRVVLKVLAVIILLLGVTTWLWSAALVVTRVPKGQLITTGPYAVVKHPLYTAFGLLVLPGISLLLGSWLGVLIGIVLYAGSRLFSPQEEGALAETFGGSWDDYCARVKIPWL
jgi:protein-S-isoprenylcysteine O-methyltransferase Ste14